MRLGSIEEFAVGGKRFEEGCSLLSFGPFLNAYFVHTLFAFEKGNCGISRYPEGTCSLRTLRGVNPEVEPVGVSVFALEFECSTGEFESYGSGAPVETDRAVI